MDLKIEAEFLARFFTLRPKVIVAASDAPVPILADEPDEPLFDVWVFAADRSLIHPYSAATVGGGKTVKVPNPPAAICVLAAQTEQAADDLEKLRVWWSANGPAAVSPVIRCCEGAAAPVLRELLRATQRELHATASQVASSSAQIYELRCEYDQTRVAVDSLQTEVQRLRQPPQLMTVSLPPNGYVYAPVNGHGVIVQPLPVSAEGMAGVDLHFPARESIAADSQVLVRLHAVDMGRDIGAWRLQAPQLGKGWVRCWLPEVLAVASHNLEVRVEWLRANGVVPPISLASVGDWNEMLARPQGIPGAIDGCLALTAWAGGVPGASLKPGPTWCTPHDDGSVEYCLHGDEIRRMRLRVPPVPWKPAEWYPFEMRPDGSFMLHPIGTPATTLQLRDGCVPGVDRITAVVKITSPNARGNVEYGIAVSRSDDAGSHLDLPDVAADPRFLAFSGWHDIPRDEAAHVIVVELAQPLAHPAHLVLATRVQPGVDHAWAWSDWVDVRLRVRGLRVPILEGAGQPKLKLVA